jgi:AraC-like DNA-binding protein
MPIASGLSISSSGLTQRVGVISELPPLLRELGIDPAEVLLAAGLDPHCLDQAENRIRVDELDRLFQVCIERTGREHIGLMIGQRYRPSHFGHLGELMRCADTVGEALRNFVVYQHLNSDIGAAFLLEEGETAALGFVIYQQTLHRADQLYDGAMAVACNMLRELSTKRWTAKEVFLPHREPSDVAPYREHFRARVRFDHPYSAVSFSRRWMDQPIPSADPARFDELRKAMEARGALTLVPQLYRALRLMLVNGRSTGDALAQALSLHRRTLNRRLRAQGTTFQHILDDVRFEIARELLAQTDLPIREIAAALCYSESSAFLHAFRRWAGTSPMRFRENNKP